MTKRMTVHTVQHIEFPAPPDMTSWEEFNRAVLRALSLSLMVPANLWEEHRQQREFDAATTRPTLDSAAEGEYTEDSR